VGVRVDPHSASFSVEKQREPYALAAGEVVLRDSHIAPKSFIGSFIRKMERQLRPAWPGNCMFVALEKINPL
jgi:hypothetical protein